MPKGQAQSDPLAGEYDYNLLVVGGGSAGLAVAKVGDCLTSQHTALCLTIAVTSGKYHTFA